MDLQILNIDTFRRESAWRYGLMNVSSFHDPDESMNIANLELA